MHKLSLRNLYSGQFKRAGVRGTELESEVLLIIMLPEGCQQCSMFTSKSGIAEVRLN